VYVDNQVVRTHNPVLKELLKTSAADREKFQKLNNLRLELYLHIDVINNWINEKHKLLLYLD